MRQLAEAAEMPRPLCAGLYDLVIVGAGPAGLAVAVYRASEVRHTLVLEAVAPSGKGARLRGERR